MLEILAPAGNVECAFAAIHNGANAIYLGYSSYSARQGAGNFDEDGLRAIIETAHFHSVRVYVAMNTIVKDTETESFLRTLLSVWNMGADAIIMQDALLGKYVHSVYPDILLHLSTQAGICSLDGAKFAKECGFSRVILARETPLTEISKISAFIETEVFIQGALCTAYSGQCYFSSFAGGNSGNRGRCKQPCRKLYAYDRNGNTEKNYALSLSDLCVGEHIDKLIEAGVVSFKIEGRMRRAEYVAAAVRYYRSLLDKQQGSAQLFSDLKRTYNRGNYTKGLAFGQDKRLLSTAIQGHLGEKVGCVKVINGKYYVESIWKPQNGDAFKILRDGKEIGGAFYVKNEGRSFIIDSKTRLKNGDGVFITTDTAVNARVLKNVKTQEISLKLTFAVGEFAEAKCGNIRITSDERMEAAENRALDQEEVKNCFYKTDGLPFQPKFESIEIMGNIFIPKSKLNAFRRKVYEALFQEKTKQTNTQYHYLKPTVKLDIGSNTKTAVIATDFSAIDPDIAILKHNRIDGLLPESFLNGSFEKYLYFPPFTTEEDVVTLRNHLQDRRIDGIYAENYGAITFAKQNGLKIFIGTGLNVINSLSLAQLMETEKIEYYAISKEANGQEAQSLLTSKSFCLSSGDIKLMDLCYCPFGKTCSVCDKRSVYTLTDENGRNFPVRRYQSADGNCRFEVYNCAAMIGKGVKQAGQLLDLTLVEKKEKALSAKDDEETQKTIYKAYTSGHLKRGIL